MCRYTAVILTKLGHSGRLSAQDKLVTFRVTKQGSYQRGDNGGSRYAIYTICTFALADTEHATLHPHGMMHFFIALTPIIVNFYCKGICTGTC